MIQKKLLYALKTSLYIFYVKTVIKDLTLLLCKNFFFKIFLINFFYLKYYLYKQTLLLFSLNLKYLQKKIFTFFALKIMFLLNQILFFNYVKLQVFGIGFSIYTDYYKICFNIGTTKTLFYILPKNFLYKILGKKQTILLIIGISKEKLYQLSNYIIQLRFPNVYTGKGIFFFKKKIFKKVGKLKQNI
jgi:hypothetical protein